MNKKDLFDSEGYIKLSDYIGDILNMRKNGPWKLPMTLGDVLNLYLLVITDKISWISQSIYVLNSNKWSPAYSMLYFFIKKRGLFDTVREVNTPYLGYYIYIFKKTTYCRERNVHSRFVSKQIFFFF